MSAAPVSRKVYAENYLNASGTISAGDAARGTHYYKRHNAAPWYAHVISNVLGSQGQIVDFEQFWHRRCKLHVRLGGIDIESTAFPA